LKINYLNPGLTKTNINQVNIKLFKHKAPIQIRFGDTDMLGHINNANYLSYMELARISYINFVFKDMINWEKKGFIQANAIINFILPILISDNIEVYIRISNVGNKSLTMEYEFIKTDENNNQVLMADGSTVIVAFDYETNRSFVIPQNWKERILEFEKNVVNAA
jgi:acyl-CoA thioester hydrolase